MKRTLTYILLACAATLAACSGGGGSSPVPTPVPTQAAQKHVVFGLSRIGAAPQARTHAAVTAQATCTVTPSNVSLQAIPASSPPNNALWEYFTGYAVVATEFDSNCNAQTSTPTYTIADQTVVSTTIPSYVQNVPTPAPGSINVAGLKQGATTITATFPDGTTATVTVGVYGSMGVSCSTNYYAYDGTFSGFAGAGWSQSAGAINSSQLNACGGTNSNTVAADMQVTNIGAVAPPSNVPGITFPNGYQVITPDPNATSPMSALAEVTSCSTFVSQGTSLPASTFVSGTPWRNIVLFKTASGACVKFYPMDNEETLDSSNNATLVGWYEVSNSSGTFAY